MARTWYCLLNGCEIGPLSSNGLRQLAGNGQLQPDDLIRNAASPEWHPARHLKGLEFPRPVQHSDTAGIGWYFRDGTVTFGPYSASEVIALGTLGLIRPSDYVRRGTNGDWIRADRIKGMRLRPERPSEPRERNVAVVEPIAAAPVDFDAIDNSDVTDNSDGTSGSGPIDDSDATDDHWKAHDSDAPGDPDATDDRRARQSVAERFLRIAKSVGQKITHSQRSDGLIAMFVILPCILPTFGPPAGGTIGTVVAIAAFALGLTLFYKRWKPIAPEYCWGGASAVFIAVFGATTLLQFTDFSMAVAEGAIAWNYGPLWLIKGVGAAYQVATESAYTIDHGSFVELIGPTILSVGIFEEGLKLLPVVLAFATRQVTRQSGLLFIGAASGLAFGVAEGVWILGNYPGQPMLSHVVVRFVGGAACHAVMTSLAVMLFLAMRRRMSLRPRFALEVMAGIAASIAMAGVHGLYDTLLVVNLRQAAGVLMSGMVITLLMLDRCGATYMAGAERSPS
jgi:RsiW-degrading membrane proteinase PrsW (M82 family)